MTKSLVQDGPKFDPSSQSDESPSKDLNDKERRKKILEEKCRVNQKNMSKSVIVQPTEEKTRVKKNAEPMFTKVNSKTLEQFDKSTDKSFDLEKEKEKYLGGEDIKIGKEQGFYDDDDEDSDSDVDQQQFANKKNNEPVQKRGFFAKLTNNIKTFTGTKNYDKQDLQEVLNKFRD